MGWYLAGDTNYQNEIKRTTVITENMSLVARWQINNDLVLVTFDANGGSVYQNEVHITKGTSLGNLLKDPTKNGASFSGWFDESGRVVTKDTKINESIKLIAKWTDAVLCPGSNSYNHSWSMWDYSNNTATCTEDGYISRYCVDCGHTEKSITANKKGHEYSEAVFDSKSLKVKCSNCSITDDVGYISINENIVNHTVTGSGWGLSNSPSLFDGLFATDNLDTVCPKGPNSFSVEIFLDSPQLVDYVFVHGIGESTFFVYVMYENESQYTKIGTSTFSGSFSDTYEPIPGFKVAKAITKVKAEMPVPSVGLDYWSEISLLQINYDNEYDPNGHKLPIWSYDALKKTRQCEICGYNEAVNYKSLNNEISNITISGEYWGDENSLYNGVWEETGIASKCTGEQVIRVDLNAATYIDEIFVAGHGGGQSYSIYVLYGGDDEYTLLQKYASFDNVNRISHHTVEYPISSIEIHFTGASQSIYWDEICFAQTTD